MATLTSHAVLKDRFITFSDKLYHSFKAHWRTNTSIILSVVIVILMITNIIGTVSFFMPQQIKQNTSQPIADSLRTDVTLYQKIPHWHIFGIPPSKDLAVAHIAVKLTGIIIDVTGKQSIAIIALPDGKEKMFMVGDVLPGGALIYAITSQEVIIQYLGRLERLPLFPITENKVQNNTPSINPVDSNPTVIPENPNPSVTPNFENYRDMLKQLRKFAP